MLLTTSQFCVHDLTPVLHPVYVSLSHAHTHKIDEKVKAVIAGQSHKVARREEGDQKWG